MGDLAYKLALYVELRGVRGKGNSMAGGTSHHRLWRAKLWARRRHHDSYFEKVMPSVLVQKASMPPTGRRVGPYSSTSTVYVWTWVTYIYMQVKMEVTYQLNCRRRLCSIIGRIRSVESPTLGYTKRKKVYDNLRHPS